MTNDKKKDVFEIVPSEQPAEGEVRQDSDEGLRKSADKESPSQEGSSVSSKKSEP
jgi:hypothetical protein